MPQSLDLHPRPKRILYPVDSGLTDRISVDTNDVKSANAITETIIHGKKHRGRTRELSLLACVHGQDGVNETRVAAIAHFDEYQARIVKHDQVDFAPSGAKIPAHRRQAFATQEIERLLFGVKS